MDRLSPAHRSENMRAIAGRNTKPELLVRKVLHRLGYRFRLHGRDLPGTPDVVLRPRRKVIFVHGCFWHSHPGCPKAYRPKSRIEFWDQKFERNQERDACDQAALKAAGWSSLVVWECEAVDSEHLRNTLTRFLNRSAADVSGEHD
jgi:DNA mismatch endonuclease (patch repair protein)